MIHLFHPFRKRQVRSLRRSVAFCTLLAFFLTNAALFPKSLFASPQPDARSGASALPLQAPSAGIIAPEWGNVASYSAGKNDDFVILLEDAHAVPAAQESLRRLIGEISQQLPVSVIGIEGAAHRLDPLAFSALPDRDIASRIFESYLANAELTGSSAALFLDELSVPFYGVEDWNLYLEGLGFFLEGKSKASEELQKINLMKSELDELKEKAYSPELLELDQRIIAFEKDSGAFLDLLHWLAGVEMPENPLVAGIVRSAEIPVQPFEIDQQLQAAEQRIVEFLEKYEGESRRSDLKAFSARRQNYDTGGLSPAAYALYLEQLNRKHGLALSFSGNLTESIERQKLLENMEGTEFFEAFEHYLGRVKEKLFRDSTERDIDSRWQQICRIEKLVRFEISRRDYELLKNETDKAPDSLDLLPWLRFYENSLKREKAMYDRLFDLLAQTSSPLDKHRIAILVAGGFHSQGLERALKANGTGYMRVRPVMGTLPRDIPYDKQMQGDVSWRRYLRADQNGHVSLQGAFLRAIRDKARELAQDDISFLKQWRDQILQRLAFEKRLDEQAGYTRFLDEILNADSPPDETEKVWHENIDAFADRLQMIIEEKKPVNSSELRALIPGSTMAIGYKSAVADPAAWLPFEYAAGGEQTTPAIAPLLAPPKRSDLRVSQYKQVQGISQYVVYQNPVTGVYAHASTRDHRREGGEAVNIRGFLRQGFEGFRFALANHSTLDPQLDENLRSVTVDDEASGRTLTGFEMDVTIDFNGSGNHTLTIENIQSSTGRYIRDTIRAGLGVDPIAGEDIRKLEALGEKLTPRLRLDGTDSGVKIGSFHRQENTRMIAYENTIQQGRYHTLLEFFFPSDFDVTAKNDPKEGIEIRGQPSTRKFRFTIRFTSDHPALTPYSEEEIFKPEFFEFRKKLRERVDAWENETFTSAGRQNSLRDIRHYEELLHRLKTFRRDSRLIEAVDKLEKKMREDGIMKMDAASALDLNAYDFNELPVFKQQTFNQMTRDLLFLTSREVLLAGSWQYLSYFGRDTNLWEIAMHKYINRDVFENVLNAILVRVSDKGEVAHEEDMRRPESDPERFDYRMMDAEFMLLRTAAEYMHVPAGLKGAERRTFLEERSKFWSATVQPKGDRPAVTRLEILNRVTQNVLQRSGEKEFVSLKKVGPDAVGDPTGNWRDAINSMARTLYPGDVNFEWAETALSSAREIQNVLGQMNLSLPVLAEKPVTDDLLRARREIRAQFEVTIDENNRKAKLAAWFRWALTKGGGQNAQLALAFISLLHSRGDAEERAAFFTQWRKRLQKNPERGLVPGNIRAQAVEELLDVLKKNLDTDASLREIFTYYALGKNARGTNIKVVNGDYSTFSPLNRDLSVDEIKLAVQAAVTPVEFGGLRVAGVGSVTANAMLAEHYNQTPVRTSSDESKKFDVWKNLDADAYHGMVIWPSMVNLMLIGWVRQVRQLLARGYRKDARMLYIALGLLRGDINNSGALKNQEVLALEVDEETGELRAVPFADGIESNDIQLWNAASEISVQMNLDELDEEMRTAFGEEVQDEWHRARDNDPAIQRLVYEWTEALRRSDLREIPETAIETIEGAAVLFAPVSAGFPARDIREAALSLNTVEEVVNAGLLSPNDIRRLLHDGVRPALEKIRMSRETPVENGAYFEARRQIMDEGMRRVTEWLAGFLERHPATGESKVTVNLNLEGQEEITRRSAASEYTDILIRYFSGEIERLALTGYTGAEEVRDLQSAGIHAYGERNPERIILMGGQKDLPVLFNGAELPFVAREGLLPIGLRLGDSDPEVRVFARFAQVAYGIALARSGADAAAIREDLLKALLGYENFPEGLRIDGIISSSSNGSVIDATLMGVFIEQATRLSIETSA